ncbi:MAG: hypothetical protein PHE05_04965 [Bacilli bacterium]|nr:hypothetical protein [Bacilli bacterium]
MKIIRILLWIVLFFDFLLVLKTIMTIPLKKHYLKKLEKVKTKKYPNIYVLLPALKEQPIVSETIDWFSKIKYQGNIKYIIVTTEREEAEYKKNNIKDKTTSMLVDEVLKQKKNDSFMHLHYPKTEGNKSSQLNYAVEQIIKTEKDLDNTYISVFDFDSKPDLNTFELLSKVYTLKDSPDVIQQVPLSFKNIPLLSNGLLILSALHQTIRSCGIEKFRLLMSSLFKKRLPQYCMGACMHIKLSTLIKNDKFPIFVDDLTLGYRLTINKARFAYLPSYNYVLIPNKLSHCFNSSVLIFKGVLTSFSEIKRVKNNLSGKLLILYEGVTNVLKLTLIPYTIILYYLYTIITGSYDLLFYLLLLLPYLWSLSAIIVMNSHKIKVNKLTLFMGVLCSPIWLLFRTFGALIYYKRYFMSKVFKRQIIYRKTER